MTEEKKPTPIEKEGLAWWQKMLKMEEAGSILIPWDWITTERDLHCYKEDIRRGIELALKAVQEWEADTRDSSDPSNKTASDVLRELLK